MSDPSQEKSQQDDSQADYLWARRFDILNRAELSTAYHRKRERFFGLLDRWDKILTLLLGSAAFVKLVNMDTHPFYALPFAILAFSSLIFDFSERARRHSELATSFKMLEAAIEAVGERAFTEDQLSAWSARIREIESGEPPVYNLLVRICQNELARARGQAQDVTHISWWRALLAHFLPFANYEIRSSK
ncbi:hypothetical protein DIE23_36705 [Burkholderia sp. Bp9143]|uniref:hypothetical protein n=1 Tax=Burkholderia TaxID=32008 RepID=UPI000F5A6342|nr:MULTISPECIES: hypothetical protein [Burkholderia]RQR22554.1 hypothetical protein DIE23_36705 [Burkholderia sp. Bp9143]